MDSLPGAPGSGSDGHGDGRLEGWGDALPGEPGGSDDEGPFYAWLPPEDRLWRHPSERRPASQSAGTPGPGAKAGSDRRPGFPRAVLVAAAVGGIAGALVTAGIGTGTSLFSHDTTVVESVLPSSPTVSLANASSGGTDWSAIDDAVAPAVVSISVNGGAGLRQGSGVVLDSVSGGATFVLTDRALFAPSLAAGDIGSIGVTFLSGATETGLLVGQDQLSDLAVVEVKRAATGLAAATGSVSDLSNAESVMAMAAPAVSSVATGSISGEDRTVALVDGTDLDDLIAVSMPARSPAAAGGPLLDHDGRVVGITVNLSPTNTADQMLTFAVPIDEATRVAMELINHQTVTHPWLGVRDVADLPSSTVRQMGIDGGVQAAQVATPSPASRAGINPDDVVLSVDGRPVQSAGQFVSAVQSCQPGRSVPVAYVHQGRTVRTTMTVGSEPYDG